MDCRFLQSQLLLMSNIAENYADLIPASDWLQLFNLAVQKDSYMTRIIEDDTKPRRQKSARAAYVRFRHTVVDRQDNLARAS